jgi:DNA mismatch repair protein MutS
MGSRLLAQWLNFPLRQLTVLQMRLDIVEYFVQERSLREELRRYLASIRDIERIVGRIALGRAQPTCLALLRQGLQVLPHIKSVINDSVPHLGKRWQQINILSDLTELLQSALVEQPVRHLHTGAVFKPEYSEALSALQELTENHDAILQKMQEAERASTGINNLKITYNRVFGYTIEVSKGQSHRVPEHYQRKQTLVNAERYTTQALVDLEHKILAAETEKSVLEASLYTDLLQKIKHYIPELRVLMKLLARTDVLLNFAYIAEEYRYTRPQLQEEPILNLKQSRHPVVERLLPADSPYVPGDLSLAANDQYIMLLTGPNMGGKSTFMRQAALNIILAQMGCFVPAQYARIGLCDRLFTRVGASDHLGRGQSTFMVEMLETATILRAATAKSFVVLDEIGRGTSTFDGMALAWSVLEYIHQTLGCRTLFATHYHELTDLPQQYSGMFNACVQAIKHQQELVFSHQVALGIAQHSFGIEVAAMAGLPNAVIHRAASIAHAWDKHATPLSLPTATEHTDVVLQQQQQQPAAYLSIEKRLMEIDPLSLTPMEALHTLCEIKELYQQSLSSPKS